MEKENKNKSLLQKSDLTYVYHLIYSQKKVEEEEKKPK